MDLNGDGKHDWQDDFLTQQMLNGDSSDKSDARWTHQQPWYAFGGHHLYYCRHSLLDFVRLRMFGSRARVRANIKRSHA